VAWSSAHLLTRLITRHVMDARRAVRAYAGIIEPLVFAPSSPLRPRRAWDAGIARRALAAQQAGRRGRRKAGTGWRWRTGARPQDTCARGPDTLGGQLSTDRSESGHKVIREVCTVGAFCGSRPRRAT
jgi:hypothetical protein